MGGSAGESRRRFLAEALGASVGLGALGVACGVDEASGRLPPPARREGALVPGPSPFVIGGRLNPEALGLPYRQDDPTWADDLMWDRDLVIRADTELNGQSQQVAESLLRPFRNGNSIGNEGCMLTCFAMVLRMFDPLANVPWTPRKLNTIAQWLYYYTPAGVSMTTLYADLVSEVSHGEIQLALKEEYLPGARDWPKRFVHTVPLVRAWRSLPPEVRASQAVMLKMGTYDDTVASHYVLLHPNDPGDPDSDDPWILDPAMPHDEAGPWRMTDCAAWIKGDPAIARGWDRDGIEDTQVGGVWVFTRWTQAHDKALLAPLVAAWAAELAR
jgi:hypothetical protein